MTLSQERKDRRQALKAIKRGYPTARELITRLNIISDEHNAKHVAAQRAKWAKMLQESERVELTDVPILSEQEFTSKIQ